MKPALVIFAYNRPVHLAALLQSIGKESLQEVASIYFYIDGPRNLETDAKLVDACADIAERFVTADVPKIINLASTNKGLRSSVIAGVSEVLSSNESCIVLEDDLILHSDSLFFLKWALASYRLDERVGSVSAYNPCEYHEGRKPAILTPRHSSWAWGTWAFIWDGFISTNLGTPSRSSERYWRRYYNLAGETLVDMYKLQRNGKIDSWSIDFDFYNWSTLRWSVCPNHNLVINRGFDEMGTHCRSSDSPHSPAMPKHPVKNLFFTAEDLPQLSVDLEYLMELNKLYSYTTMERIKCMFRRLVS